MNQESLNLLEYESLRALLGRYVASELGHHWLEQMEPICQRSALQQTHAETAEALSWLDGADRSAARGEYTARLRFEGIPDPGPAVAKLRIEGAVLDGLEISALVTLLERAAEVRSALAPQESKYPLLSDLASLIGDFRHTLKEVTGKILPDGSVADHASPALARVRREIERQRRQIQESLERFVRQHRDDGLLQEEFVTIRNDRFVVPVIPGARKRVPGVVHAASGSGQTLFLEPLDAVDLNNDLIRLTDEELREVHRILRELTLELRQQADAIRTAVEVLGRLDFIFARAHFGQEFHAVIPTFTPEDRPHLRLKEARHPLLQDVLRRKNKKVVPVSLELDSVRRTLLISGPNTGGKTVSMKTVGLLALMAQSGLPVPASEAELPIFDDVLADIGDNQSIEQSLSSFSSHVARIKEMVEAATPGVLVLLDELGRATDPEEGGALGVAILEEFRHFGAFTLASTHLLALKVYGSNTQGVVNASMGFNEDTLEPTYVLRIGSPGKSAGLDIATRLGLPSHLIERAREAMSSTDRDIAHFLNELEKRTTEAQQETERLRLQKAELDAREQELEKRMEKREAARLRAIEERAAQAQKQFEQEAKATIESVLSNHDQRRQAERAFRQVARTKREFQEAVGSLNEKVEKPAAAATEEIKVGSRVRLKDVAQPSKVLRVMANGMLEVEVGFLKMQVPVSEVKEILPANAGGGGNRLPSGVSFSQGPRWDTLSREVNLIGKNSEEAQDELERFIDAAVLAEVTRVRVVHGHGMGVLKKMVQTVLGKHSQVDKFYPAPSSEGGTGATIVELRSA